VKKITKKVISKAYRGGTQKKPAIKKKKLSRSSKKVLKKAKKVGVHKKEA
jgi:hypothetical protein